MKRISAVRVLAVMPPMVQVNTPYPSTACLTGFLRSRGVEAFQADLALELAETGNAAGLAVIGREFFGGSGLAAYSFLIFRYSIPP